MRWINAALGALTTLAVLGIGGVPVTVSPPPTVELRAVAPWNPVLYIEEQFAQLPYGAHAELVIEDLPPMRPESDGPQPSAWVAETDPTTVRLDRAWVESIPRSDARRLQATVVHELTHSAIYQSGAPIPDDLLLDATDTWAAGALAVSDDPQQQQGLEAIGACVEQAGLPPHMPASYLSGQCPPGYLDVAFAYLESITGENWRPSQLPG